MRPTVLNLQPGESGYIADHGAFVSGDQLYVNGGFAIDRFAHGTFGLRLVRFPNGELAADATQCSGNPFERTPAFVVDNATLVHVDRMLTPPLPAVHKRLFDMKPGEHAWVSMDAAWIHGPHMWLDGLARVSDEKSEDTPLLIERSHEGGAYLCDPRLCNTRPFGNDWNNDSAWPIQVYRAIQSRYLQ